jgi:hypothetical protein
MRRLAIVGAAFLFSVGCDDTENPPSPTPLPTSAPTAAPTPKAWSLGMTETEWTNVYHYDPGTFTLSFDALAGILMAPPVPADASETRAMLLLSNRTISEPIRDFTVTVRVSTEEQLRAPDPNSWEVFWLFFNYRQTTEGNPDTKETNYFLLKPYESPAQPGGVEFGRAWNVIDQAFLSTASAPKLTIGETNVIRILKSGQHLEAFVDDVSVLSFDGDPADRSGCGGSGCRLFDAPGEIGLYTEDARGRVLSVTIEFP